ncbi:MAG: hypothetical protein ABI867_29335 [Kofleriaceae bacterium]
MPTAKLSDEAAAALAERIRQVRAQQAEELRQAIDAALEHVPRLLRGALRKVLF